MNAATMSRADALQNIRIAALSARGLAGEHSAGTFVQQLLEAARSAAAFGLRHEAAALVDQATDFCQRRLGPQHPITRRCVRRLVLLRG